MLQNPGNSSHTLAAGITCAWVNRHAHSLYPAEPLRPADAVHPHAFVHQAGRYVIRTIGFGLCYLPPDLRTPCSANDSSPCPQSSEHGATAPREKSILDTAHILLRFIQTFNPNPCHYDAEAITHSGKPEICTPRFDVTTALSANSNGKLLTKPSNSHQVRSEGKSKSPFESTVG